ncbi:diguanylate cyclase domain-containing protein [Litchfieldia salsa]|uniref:PAS domain S-box-containing protein/diguanylate cyclase (GGDEF) domain-containing protein n=1 Tax=Litchfieldia salsa TaxID=930152 RepID=A0A1H0W3Y0_9BACI|nr:diguanylate cyclase [Litchfieldia salsa]SDP85444.1 PAS domain S-box-containing protein/diguanylate cyclase (GGDEF) domain-containing protein [Litchfieldia salsa]
MISKNRYIVPNQTDFTTLDELELIWENTNDAIFLIAPNGSVLRANPAFEVILGFSSEELRNDPQPPIIPQHLIKDQKPFLEKMKKGERLNYYEIQRLTKTGELLDIVASYSPVLNHDGELLFTVAMYKDVTEQVAAQKKVRESEEKYRFIAENTSDLIMILDEAKMITYVSPSIVALLNVLPEDCMNKSISDFLYEEDVPLFMALVDTVTKNKKTLQLEVRYKSGHNEFLWMDVKGSSVVEQDKTRTIIVSRDISERKKHEEELRYLAFHDTLTGLPNRYHFNELLNDEIKKCRKTSSDLALMYLDIDLFKNVNDTLGHAGGDAVLIEFSRRIKRSIRSTDKVCRLSGDEFVVIISEPFNQDNVQAIVKRIQAEIEKPMVYENQSINITTSIGISTYNGELSPEEIVKRADQALYEVKENGKNNVYFW